LRFRSSTGGEEHVTQIAAKFRSKKLRAFVHRGAECRFRRMQLRAHPGVL
jgi:hypothetical protein